MMLAVLALTVHPLQLPDVSRAVDVELLPPLTPPPTPTVDLQLRPRQAEPEPVKPPLLRTRPQSQVLPKEVEVKPPPKVEPRQLMDVARPSRPELGNPVEVERKVQAPRLQSQQAAPQIPEAPPEPVAVARPAPALRPPVELPRTQAQTRPLDANRAPPQLPQAQAPETPAPVAPSQIQVLTNQNLVQAPVEIRPRERAPASPRLSGQAALPEIPAAGGGQPPGGNGVAGSGGQGGARAGGAALGGVNGPLDLGLRGLRGTLGCENPDTYKLTPEEREVCLQRFAQRAKAAPQLGPNIPAKKEADYERYTACHQAYKQALVPSSEAPSEGTSITGLGPNPSLKECGPGDR